MRKYNSNTKIVIVKVMSGMASIIIIIIETFVTRLLQLKNEHKRYICYIKIYKNRLKDKNDCG